MTTYYPLRLLGGAGIVICLLVGVVPLVGRLFIAGLLGVQLLICAVLTCLWMAGHVLGGGGNDPSYLAMQPSGDVELILWGTQQTWVLPENMFVATAAVLIGGFVTLYVGWRGLHLVLVGFTGEDCGLTASDEWRPVDSVERAFSFLIGGAILASPWTAWWHDWAWTLIQ